MANKTGIGFNTGGYKVYKIGTTEDIDRTLQRLVNDVVNKRLELGEIRMINELIKTKLCFRKQEDLEKKIEELEKILLEKEDKVV